ncbi:MAG: hypothetical protein KTR27_14355 [Leptolyngbyaceae cyanobacterium MAG.088]|nr:hypothetical protein [Leptolyngbyaceae cyanobacterium MAG.088]
MLGATKTDRVNAGIIAQFCFERKPRAWTPPAPEVEALQALVRRLNVLEKMITQERKASLETSLLSYPFCAVP